MHSHWFGPILDSYFVKAVLSPSEHDSQITLPSPSSWYSRYRDLSYIQIMWCQADPLWMWGSSNNEGLIILSHVDDVMMFTQVNNNFTYKSPVFFHVSGAWLDLGRLVLKGHLLPFFQSHVIGRLQWFVTPVSLAGLTHGHPQLQRD